MTVRDEVAQAFVAARVGGNLSSDDAKRLAYYDADIALAAIRKEAQFRLMDMSDKHARRCDVPGCPFHLLDDPEGDEIVEAILGEKP